MHDRILVIDTAEGRLSEMVAVMQSRGFSASGIMSADEAVGVAAHDQPNCVVLGDLPAAWDRKRYCRLLRRLLSRSDARIFTLDEDGVQNGGEGWLEPLFDDVLPCIASGYCLAEMAVTLLTARKRQRHLLSQGGFSLDAEALQLSGYGASIGLSRQMALIMTLLMRAPHLVHSRDDIRQAIEWQHSVQSRSVDVYIQRLRGAARRNGLPNPIETIHGRGYRLSAPA